MEFHNGGTPGWRGQRSYQFSQETSMRRTLGLGLQVLIHAGSAWGAVSGTLALNLRKRVA